jgi:predicted acylesterase/phospholipase RssA
MTSCDLVLSGSGTLLPVHSGAAARLSHAYDIARVAGTSGGAIVAAAIAYGIPYHEQVLIAKEVLAGGLLDRRPLGLVREGWGLHGFDRLHAIAEKHLPGRMDSAELTWGAFVVDVETRRPLWLNSRRHGHLKTADVVTASASIPFFARARPIAGMPSLYVDGGVSANFALGVWDDVPERPTIGVRIHSSAERQPVRNTYDFTRAMLGALLDNANRTHISSKRYAHVIEVESSGDGMQFVVPEAEVEARFQEGALAAHAWLETTREAA